MMRQPGKRRKRVSGSKGKRHTRARDPKDIYCLLKIAAKLKHQEPLEPEESVVAGNLLGMIAHGTDVLALFHEPVSHSPQQADEFYIALHYGFLKGTNDAAGIVADAWGYEDDKSVLRIWRKRKSECVDIIAIATTQTRQRHIKSLEDKAQVAKRR